MASTSASLQFLAFHSLPSSPPNLHRFTPSSNLSVLFSSKDQIFPLRHSPPFSASSSDQLSSALENEGEVKEEEVDVGDKIKIEVVKVKRNRRKVIAKIEVSAGLEIVWGLLTDYEGLADFIPSLSVCKLLEKGENFAKLYQVGQQDLALGLKFNAKGIIDCYEKHLEILPFGQRRNIEFRMVEGDFQTFEGLWSILEDDSEKCKGNVDGREFQSILSYTVELEPKLWLPVRLIEGRICREQGWVYGQNIATVESNLFSLQGFEELNKPFCHPLIKPSIRLEKVLQNLGNEVCSHIPRAADISTVLETFQMKPRDFRNT